MVRRDIFRCWAASNLAPIIFLSAYFFTIVLGNVLYNSAYGHSFLSRFPYTARILEFETLFKPGFWALLLVPFVVTPIIVFFVKRTCSAQLYRIADIIPEIRKIDFILLNVICVGLVLFAMFRADAFVLFSSGRDAISSVEARFQIRSQMGFMPLIVLMSVLHFLSIYSFVRWMRGPDTYWRVVSICSAAFMTVFLVLLNMKWPVLIYYSGLVLAIFVYARKWVYPKTIAGAVLLIVFYLLISSFVFRLAPVEVSSVPTTTEMSIEELSGDVGGVAGAAFENAPMLLFAVVNRMAIIYPYYYELFSTEGAVCGGVFAQMKFGQPCRPSTYVYTYIFGNDGFEGRGTSPAPVHVSGYALGGWWVALFALLAASVILGLFASLPLDLSATVGAFVITGAVAGYHFSQLPGEGPLLYDHGVVWSMLVVLAYSLSRIFFARLRVGRDRDQ